MSRRLPNAVGRAQRRRVLLVDDHPLVRERLAEILQRPITSFAYPHGGRLDFTWETARIVADAGFDCACSAEIGAVWPSSDLYALPRISVGDWDASVLEKILR